MRCYCETVNFEGKPVPSVNIVPEDLDDVKALAAMAGFAKDTVAIDDSGNAHCALSVVVQNAEVQNLLKNGAGSGSSNGNSGLPPNPGLPGEAGAGN